MRTTFIYALCEPGTRTVRYIGMTENPKRRLRDHNHTSAKLQTHLGKWLRTLNPLRWPPNLIILSQVPVEQGPEEERRYIAAAKMLGIDLVNGTEGGEGFPCGEKHPQFGTHRSKEAREKTSRALKGRVFTEEHCDRISKGLVGIKKSPAHCKALRKPKTAEHRRALALSKTGTTQSLSHRRAGAESRRGKKRPDASSKFLGVHWDPARRKWVAGIKFNKLIFLGRFELEKDAAMTYDKAAREFFGVTAKTNFPTITSEITKTTNESIKL